MFRVDFIVDDKKLAKVLNSLGGDVYNLQVRPVQNAKADHGKVKEVTGNFSAPELTRQFILTKVKAGEKKLLATDLKSELAKNHVSVAAAQYGLRQMLEQGILSRRTRGEYVIHAPKAEKGA
ncbi:MAG TPA: hypothetical protein VFR24_27650 [Candidatus Angelobacter sp.]|nr:hypothetical protein [Candidatus Angelobacter sp.]